MDALTDVRAGDVLAGKYRIEQVLGQGGMGVVVSAIHLQLDERVAIKFLLPDALSSPEAVARFAREARAAVKIKSEHVARVIDVGTLETGCPYMVMEYLRGYDLSAVVQQRGALGIEETVEYVLQACEAIAEAHALGIVHRDLKPQNLFLAHRADGSPCVKVLDFGISKVTNLSGSGVGSDMNMTKTTAVMGSPLYMSPEQMASTRDVDFRTDVWALGVILYELLTGRVPFLADTVPQLCAMILQSSTPPLRDLRPDAPEALQVVVLRCLEKDMARRYQNVAELARALLPFAPRSGRTSVERISRVLTAAGVSNPQLEPPPSSVAPGPVQPVTQTAWGQSVPARSRAPWIAVSLALLLAGGTALSMLLGPSTPQAASPEASATLAGAPLGANDSAAGSSMTEATAASAPAPAPEPTDSPTASADTKAPTTAPVAAAKPAARPAKAPTQPRATAVPPAPPAAHVPTPPPASHAQPRRPSDLYSDRK